MSDEHNHHSHHKHSLGHYRRKAAWHLRKWMKKEKAREAIDPKRAKAVRALPVLAGFLVLLAVVLVLTSRLEQVSAVTSAPQQAAAVTETTETDVVTYQGVTYVPKTNVDTYLFLGVDKERAVKDGVYFDAGQADVQLLLVIDRNTNTWQMLAINRDTMTEVSVLGPLGAEVGTKRAQIAVAHGYGDGKGSSCRNAVKAVSGLLRGANISHYFALNMGGVSQLVDEIGGLTVTFPDDYSDVDPAMTKGSTVKLTGEQLYKLIRSRKTVQDGTNVNRMKRQKLVIDAFFNQRSQYSTEQLVKAIENAGSYIVTDLSTNQLGGLVRDLKEMDKGNTLELKGSEKIVNNLAEFTPDEDSLTETILQLFYTPQK